MAFRQPFARAVLVLALVLGFGAATARAATLLSVEAESMTTSGKVRSDSKASGGRAVLLSTNGSLSATVTLGSAASSVVVTVRGDQCQGAPVATLKVDGADVQSVPVTSTAWAAYTVPAAIGAGSHTVAIAYANDFSTRQCDRNLYVDKLTLMGDPVPSAYSVKHVWLNSDTSSAFDFAADSPKIDRFIAHAA